MRFLVDESTGIAVAEYLRSMGHDVLAVGETMPQADDFEILALAARENRIVVTNDKDFGMLVFRSGQAHQGILLLRLADERLMNRIHLVRQVLEQYGHLLPGHFVVATEKRVRVRPL